MSRPTAVVIVGGGVAGISAAVRAAELGAEVTLLERRHLAAGSSGLSAGVFSINQTDALMTEIRIRAREVIDHLQIEHGMHVGRIGYMRLARKESHLELFEETVELQREMGVKPSRILDVAGIQRLIPDLRTDDLVGGLFNDRDGHIDGSLVCGALKDIAEGLGAQVRQRSEVTSITQGLGRHRHEVHVGGEVVAADVVVNSAGPWAARVGEMLGAPLPLLNQRHEMIHIKLPRPLGYTMPMVQEYVAGEGEAINFRQDGPDTLLGSLHSNEILDRLGSQDPEEFAQSIDLEDVERVAVQVSRRLPIEDLGFAEGWAGLYPMSPDGQYIVGPYAHDPSIVACGGFGGSGLASGLALGRVAAEWAVAERPRTLADATALLPDRTTLSRTEEAGPLPLTAGKEGSP